jgi:hypothetical protein
MVIRLPSLVSECNPRQRARDAPSGEAVPEIAVWPLILPNVVDPVTPPQHVGHRAIDAAYNMAEPLPPAMQNRHRCPGQR